MGHLEACAAAAGLASLVITPLLTGTVPTNAQLLRCVCKEGSVLFAWSRPRLRLNAHVVSLLSSCGSVATFEMPVETEGRVPAENDVFSETPDALSTGQLSGRLSSFGFSGTITHGLFGCGGFRPSEFLLTTSSTCSNTSLLRAKKVCLDCASSDCRAMWASGSQTSVSSSRFKSIGFKATIWSLVP